jgi:cytoskeletal protein CcmA (bactofilin family)
MFARRKSDFSFNDRDLKAFLEHGCEFEGKLTFSGVVRLNGKLRGDIESEDTLIVGESAEIDGTLNVGAAVIAGRVTGDIKAKHRIEIHATGIVSGTIQSPTLVTHEGAQLMGQVHITSASQPEERMSHHLDGEITVDE